MTTPEEFYKNILEIWKFLDTVIYIYFLTITQKLPKGSHMVVLGLADGTVLYDTLHDKLHPIGVDYTTFYDFLNCNVMSPCAGWMNSDPSSRAATTVRANQLNSVY